MVVRSPGCDHGHDEESRNGRDIKIDILDHVIRTPEVFRMISGKTGVPEGLPETPGELMGLMGLKWRIGGAARAGRAPPLPLVRIGQGGRGGAPPFLPLLSPFLPPSPTRTRKGRGVLLPVGVGLLLRASYYGRPHPPWLLYIRGQGGTLVHTS